jgi:hypothetical protein
MYALIDPYTNSIVFGVGSGRFDADLDDIEAYLSGSLPWQQRPQTQEDQS